MRKRPHISAIIFDKKGRVISVGQNSYIKTHPMQARLAANSGRPEAIYLHAEIHAITRCADINKAHRILVTRYDSLGRPVMAKPCAICSSAIAQTPIQIIDHT